MIQLKHVGISLAGLSLCWSLTGYSAELFKEDFKCFSVLADTGEKVVSLVSFRVASSNQAAAQEAKNIGYYDSESGRLRPIASVYECVRFSQTFSQQEANDIFAKTPF
ncbi:hypothetical protein [Gayadomonas joobiniege]|uniref:hypothetical protein n=1 Tax=Gayadomonas joobiniege TaxID=1234606 RepID=UPI000362FC77|nr:hypothetical protein [Gayadomonas joobiniege]